jgi:hypothetical protein
MQGERDRVHDVQMLCQLQCSNLYLICVAILAKEHGELATCISSGCVKVLIDTWISCNL